MTNDEKTTITLHSYQKVWYYKKYLYRVGGKVLYTPVADDDVWSFSGSLMILVAIKLLFRLPIGGDATVPYYLGVPLLVTAVLRYKTFDGKHPLKFLGDYAYFLLVDRHKQTEFFVPVKDEPTHAMVWQVGYRYRLRLQQKDERRQRKP